MLFDVREGGQARRNDSLRARKARKDTAAAKRLRRDTAALIRRQVGMQSARIRLLRQTRTFFAALTSELEPWITSNGTPAYSATVGSPSKPLYARGLPMILSLERQGWTVENAARAIARVVVRVGLLPDVSKKERTALWGRITHRDLVERITTNLTRQYYRSPHTLT